MSHFKERKHKNCLNCNAHVHGKYCHICGQENIEPEETAWHLVTHFFNDITHFDGKFFSTLKLLVFKPGFLSAEYKRGRRASYLNPIRMYLFTSFVFFLVFFSAYDLKEIVSGDDEEPSSMLENTLKLNNDDIDMVKRETRLMDSSAFDLFSRAINRGRPLSKLEFYRQLDSTKLTAYPQGADPVTDLVDMDSVQKNRMTSLTQQMDSLTFDRFTKTINGGASMTRADFEFAASNSVQGTKISFFGKDYQNRAQFDSIMRASPEKLGTAEKFFVNKVFDIKEKYKGGGRSFVNILLNTLFHYVPQLLFISLPLFALFLKLIYVRRKYFHFVSHGIYSVHLYIFYFIALLFIIGLNKSLNIVSESAYKIPATIIFFLLLLYEYKAMKNFYGQGRTKTIIKFLLAVSWRFIVILFLFFIYLIFSLTKV